MLSTRVFLNTWAILLFLFFHMQPCHGDGAFVKPPPEGLNKDYSGNEVYYVGDILPIQWTKSLSQVTITMFQDNRPGDGSLYPHQDIVTNATGDSYDWEVSTMGMDLARHNVFYCILSAPGNVEFNTHYFNISAERPASSSAAESSTATSITSTSASIIPGTAATAPPSPTGGKDTTTPSAEATTSAGSQVTPGQAAGLTIGGIVGLVVIIGGGWYAMRRSGISVEVRRHKKPDGGMAETAELPESGAVAEAGGDTPVAWKYGSELALNPIPLEAGSSPVYEAYAGGRDRHELP